MPTEASQGTNQYRCSACGRYFNDMEQLRAHEPECRLAKQSTAEGRRELSDEDARPVVPNDRDKDDPPFQHGTRRP